MAEFNGDTNPGQPADTILGLPESDLINGLTADDRLVGNGGADTINGDEGNDTLFGDAGDDSNPDIVGADLLLGGTGNDSIQGGPGNDTLFGGEDDDTLIAGLGVDVLHGEAGNDSLVAGELSDNLFGGAGNDTLVAGLGGTVLNGGAGADVLQGSADGGIAAYLEATSGVLVNLGNMAQNTGDAQGDTYTLIDVVFGSNHADTLIGDDGDNHFEGFEGNDSIAGLAGADYLSGGGGTDTILGGAGSDFIRGGAGADSIDGGNDPGAFDTVGYEDASSGVNVDLGTGLASGGAGNDTLVSIENLHGSSHNDTLVGTAAANYFMPRGGDDSIVGGLGVDTLDFEDSLTGVVANLATGAAQQVGTTTGGSGTDSFSGIENLGGTFFADTLIGDDQNNGFEPGSGDDSIDGGAGSDVVNYEDASVGVVVNLVTGLVSQDGAFQGGSGNDTLSGIENVRATAFGDTLIGNAGDNIFVPGSGNDSVVGGGGVDLVSYSSALESIVVDLGAGTAQSASIGQDTLAGISEVVGSEFNDTLIGHAGDNNLNPGSGNDSIVGGAGFDQLVYGTFANPVTVTMATSTVQTGTVSVGGVPKDTFRGIERVIGTAFGDSMLGGDLADSFRGMAGNDTLDGGDGPNRDQADYRNDPVGIVVNLTTGTGTDGWGNTDTLLRIENVRGSRFAGDSITGNGLSNRLEGEAGNDTLLGLEGDDELVGGDGSDRLEGGAGRDVLFGDGGADALYGDDGNDNFAGGAGADTFVGGAGIDWVNGFQDGVRSTVRLDLVAGTLTLTDTQTGVATVDVISEIESGSGSQFADTFIGVGLDNRFMGLAGADSIIGGAGVDDFTDVFYYDDHRFGGTQGLVGDLSAMSGTVSAGTITDGFGATDSVMRIDAVYGTAFGDLLVAGVEDLQFAGGDGADTFIGGAGFNELRYNNDAQLNGLVGLGLAGIIADLSAMTSQVAGTVVDGYGDTDSVIGVESIRGTNSADLIRAPASGLRFRGLGGNDTFVGGSGTDMIDYRRDVDNGGSGGVIVNLSDAAVTLTGQGTFAAATARDGFGTIDLLRAPDASLTLIDGARGTSFSDTLIGSAGNNTLNGEEGPDSVDGGAGDDSLVGAAGNDTLSGGEGNDTIEGGGGAADLAVYAGARSAYTVTALAGGALQIAFSAPNAQAFTDVVSNVERFSFSNGEFTAQELLGSQNQAPALSVPLLDQVVLEDGTLGYTIPAEAFTDANGDPLTYAATLQGGGPLPAWLTFDPATRTFSGTPVNANVGTLNVTVTATDPGGLSASDTFALTVQNTNDAPVLAAALADQAATEDAAFTYTVPSNAYADLDPGDTLSLSATGLPAWLTFNAATLTFSGTPGNGDVGTVNVTVTATDSAGATATDTFALTVANANDAPTVAAALADQAATEDAAFSFTVPSNAFADVDPGDTLAFSATGLPAWLTFNAATRTFSGTPGNGDVGTVNVTVTATDSAGATATDTFALTVANANDAPTVASLIADVSVIQGAPVSLALPPGTFADVDAGDSLSISVSGVPAWLSFDAQAGTFSGTPGAGDVGSSTVTVRATDLAGASVADTFQITVTNANVPADPATGLVNGLPGATTFGDAAFAARNDDLTTPVSVASIFENGLNFFGTTFNQLFLSNNGRVTFGQADSTFTPFAFSGATQIPHVSAFFADVDTRGGATAVTPGGQSTGSNNVYVALDPVKDRVIFTWDDVGYFNSATNKLNAFQIILTDTSSSGQAGDFSITFRYEAVNWTTGGASGGVDGLGGTVARAGFASGTGQSGTFELPGSGSQNAMLDLDTTVGNTGQVGVWTFQVSNGSVAVPVITSPSSYSVAEGQTAVGTVTGNLSGLSFSIAGGADAALFAIDSATGALSFLAARDFEAPADAGTNNVYNVDVRVSNGSLTSTSSLAVTVTNVNETPVVAAALQDQGASEGTPFLYAFAAGSFSDPDGNALSYAASLEGGGALPSWLTFDAATRTFSGTPGPADAGSLAITVTASDPSGAGTSDTFVLTVSGTNDAPNLVAPLLGQAATEDAAFSFVVPAGSFADADGDALSYSAALAGGGPLPGWLAFDPATRTFSGTPANGDVGAFDVRVTASDPSGATASSTFTLTVANANDATTVAAALADQAATEDAAFSFTVPSNAFADVDAGDTLAFSATGLPAWLTFDAATRTFSGTPGNGDVGSVNVTVTATDSAGATASDTFALTVANTNDAPVLAAPLSDQAATEDAAFTLVLPVGAFTDADGDSLTYSATLQGGGALPAWLTFDAATRTFSGTPANGDVGTVNVTVTATDSAGATASDTFALTVANANDAPTVAAALADQTATEDAAFSFTVPSNAFADVDPGDTLAFSATGLPAWLTFDAATRTFSGTPANGDVGTVNVTVTATDPSGAAVSDTFAITVANTNDAPTLSLTPTVTSLSEAADTAARIKVADIVVQDDGLGTNTLSLAGPDAGFFEIDGGSLYLRAGVPLDHETLPSLSVSVVVDDPDLGAGPSDSRTFVLDVTNANEDPVILIGNSALTVSENDPGAIIAVVSVIDPDFLASIQLTVSDNRFRIFTDPSDNLLKLALQPGQALDYEAAATIPLVITATDQFNASASVSITIGVIDVQENLAGGTGADTLSGLGGAYTLAGGSGNDRYLVDGPEDLVVETPGDGTDTLEARGNGLTLAANVENLVLGAGVLTGNGNDAGNDVRGNAEANTVNAGGGDDTVLGEAGNDTLLGGSGIDRLFGGAGGDSLDGGSGNDQIIGGDGGDTLVGGGDNDTMWGEAGDDSIQGSTGNDQLIGQAGNDTMSGGGGDDSYGVDDAGDVVIEAGGGGTDTVHVSVDGFVMSADIERLVLVGSAVSATGGSGANMMHGNGLANVIAGAAGMDTLVGGGGNDTLTGGADADDLFGEAGNDGLDGGDGDDKLIGGTGDDAIAGGAGNDMAWGEAGSDIIDGGAGADSMIGGADDDFYLVDSIGDVLFEVAGGGTDTVFVSVSGYVVGDSVEIISLSTPGLAVTGNASDNIVNGSAGADTVAALAGDDWISGGAGADSLLGGEGNDTIYGGSGGNVLVGGAGNDLLFGSSDVAVDVFRHGGAAVDGLDFIYDYDVFDGDVIDLAANDYEIVDGGSYFSVFEGDVEVVRVFSDLANGVLIA